MLQRTSYEEIPDFNGRQQRVENCRIKHSDSRKILVGGVFWGLPSELASIFHKIPTQLGVSATKES
jgi:hypothetical protein